MSKYSLDITSKKIVFNVFVYNFKDMTKEELQNEFGDAVCVYCNKNIIPEHNLGIGCLCEGNWCEEAQDGYAEENNIELED